MTESRAAGGHAMAAARDEHGAERHAAYAAGQAGVVGHVAAHELGAAAYAIKAARVAAPGGGSEAAGRLECRRRSVSSCSTTSASGQHSKTDQQMSFRNRWSSSTRLTDRLRHSSRPAASDPPAGAAARAALIA